ncbi:MAG TPA: BREX-1 system phosphatase PglZ type B [Pseudomonas sp.]|nr:BREX-1 system phosphatase PglZ type B [Pseudomonas sp.]
MSRLIESLASALQRSASYNKGVQVESAAILWTDGDGQWQPVIGQLRKLGVNVLTLGVYSPEQMCGPAIWLKCAIAGVLPEIPTSSMPPVVYLPGVSRSDLRAIESCPRDLQPLAELQYRGVFWSQVNAKDWTINAFLTSKNGGLGLDVSQDRTTQEALIRALGAGVLLERALDELQGRQINAAWLDSLLAPNPIRDVLLWMNDPVQAQYQWAGGRWEIFSSRCKKDFGLDPRTDGALTAAERLAAHENAWEAVWELYRDSYTSFPAVADLLAKVQPPAPKGLFDDLDRLAGYPRANEESEAALRYQLNACGGLSPAQARTKIFEVEADHAHRRYWLWARMGQAPLAHALEHLAELAKLSAQMPNGSTLKQMAEKYQESGWKVDWAAIQALAAVQLKADIDAVGSVLRALYAPWLEDTAQRFQQLVKAEGGLGIAPSKVPPLDDGVCTVFVDGLRYDVAMSLKERLAGVGTAEITACWTSMPSVTASGKAWASPVAHAVSGKMGDEDFQPSIAETGKPLTTYNLRKLLDEHGYRVLEKHEVGDAVGNAWVECGDLDHYGHEHGLRLARGMDAQLQQIEERLVELKDAGWTRFRIVTDHGWLLVPGGLPKTELSKFEAQTRWGRCALLKDSSHGTSLTFGWDWCKDVQIAYAPGVASFIAGSEYAHGGLTLQECLVPVLDLQVEGSAKPSITTKIVGVAWKGLRCVVQVESKHSDLTVDIRTKAALAESSLVASVKPVNEGKSSLAIADDDHIGSAAMVVVLDGAGEVVQKMPVTVGE